MTPKRAPTGKPEPWCQRLTKALDEMPSTRKLSDYKRRVDWAVVGAAAAALVLLGGGTYVRMRLTGKRPRSTIVWLLVFVIVLIAVLVNGRLRFHPAERNLARIPALNCHRSTTQIRASCAATCDKLEKLENSLGSSSPISRILYITTPLVFVFAAVAFFSIYRTSTPMRRRRTRGVNNMTFGAPSPIAVFSVAMPTRPVPVTPNFTLKSVQEGDDEDGKTDPLCAICLTDIWSQPVGELSCRHRFHTHCVSDWLRKAPRPTCPLCKAIVGDEEEGAQEPVV